MRIGEMSRRTGVPVPTIKYYLREGLLSPGELTSPNQARYGEAHVRRLKLIRALTDVGKLSIAAVGEVLGALDEPEQSLHHVLGVMQRSVSTNAAAGDEAAHQEAEKFLARRGWHYHPDDPSVRALVDVVVKARELGHDRFVEQLDAYADACQGIAEADLDHVLRRTEVEDVLEGVVVGTMLGDAAIAALRRLAQQAVSARRLGEV
ncbi:MAG TPA: MerR family transcriptional regulator [Pseudonocardiaceae bacterium]|nr:MerR family transcriptional regulator [Pseudonocardiaceae bacterium]